MRRPEAPGRGRRGARAAPSSRPTRAGWRYTAEALVAGEELEAADAGLPRRCRCRARRASGVFEQLVRLTFKDVHAYFFRGSAERMRAVVRDALAGIDEPFVVVAHSLGTIIAYDVLREAASARSTCRCS